jgi:sec-independent protein translocase protein TatB
MSFGQLFLTTLIALLVFGPDKLPMLARHAGRLIARLERYKQQAITFWQQQLNEQQLQENTRKAHEADVVYQQDRTTHHE